MRRLNDVESLTLPEGWVQNTHYKLGHVAGGSVVEVTLQGSGANVRLMDQSNFNSYKAGRLHRYHGGLAKSSPVRLQVPRSGTWHVIVDMQGLRGTVRSGLRVIPAAALKPLPPINEGSLFRNIRHEQPSGVDAADERVFDVTRAWAHVNRHATPKTTAQTERAHA